MNRTNWPLYTGILAGSLTTISFIPQLLKVYTSKHARDISLVMFVIFTAGISLWLVYGFMIVDIPIIVANSVTLVLASSILFLKLKYK